VIEINIPPLRERREDIPALCEALLKRIAAESGLAVPQLSSALLEQIGQLPLHGNVRELENLLHRAVALSEGKELQLDRPDQHVVRPAAPFATPLSTGLSTSAHKSPHLALDLQGHLDQQERDILVKTLQETGFNRTVAAARLGLSLRQIRYRMTRLNIEVPLDGSNP
jgi:two-component system response regulator PilR (NtrC family)